LTGFFSNHGAEISGETDTSLGEDQCLVSITYKTYIKFVELFKKELKSFLCVFVLTLYATYYSPFYRLITFLVYNFI
jgi:hypothetical protein